MAVESWRQEKAGKWQVPIPKVKAMTEDEMFKILRSGKRKKKAPQGGGFNGHRECSMWLIS